MRHVKKNADEFEQLFEDYHKGNFKSLLKKVEKLAKVNTKK